MASLGRLSNLSSVENTGEMGICCGSFSQSVRSGIHMLNYKSRNQDLCRAQKICCAAVATERKAGSAGTRSNDQSLLDVLNGMRESGFGTSIVDDSRVCNTRKKVIDKEEDVSGKLDQWVKESVHEILNSLDEAPLLVQIYSDGEDGDASTTKCRLVKEKAGPNTWPSLRDRWNGETTCPNGVVLVGEIDTGEADDSDEVNCGSIGVINKSSSSSSTKVWGIIIQGKGGNYPACYILKTSKVRGLAGFCTHFCLARVECFVEHVDILFKKVWLL